MKKKLLIGIIVGLVALTLVIAVLVIGVSSPKHEHTEIIKEELEPTCTQTGLTEGKYCSTCGEVLVAQRTVTAKGHTEGDWIVDKEATKAEDGSRHTECLVCKGVVRTETIFAFGSTGLDYQVNDDGATCTIVGLGACTDEHVVVPAKIDGYVVNSIGYKAFYQGEFNEITIPKTISYIGEYAFNDCLVLKKINYNGTKDEWGRVNKAPYWNFSTFPYNIYFTDGMASKTYFTINDTLPDGEGKTATVIILAGQSNAAGCSLDEYLQKNVSAEKYAEYKNGYDNVYINNYSDNRLTNGFVKCSVLQGGPDGCFGPELGLADKLHELYPDRTFYIVKCAWSGTNLFEQWLSPSSEGKTGKLYTEFITYVQTSIRYLQSKNYNVEIEAMCWMQGESDSFSVENGVNYENHLTNFIGDIRKHFKSYLSKDGMAFVDAYIADNPMYWVYCDYVNESKKNVADSSPMNVVIDTIAHGLSCSEEPVGTVDMAHYDSLSEIKLGHLFAEEVAKFLD